MVGQQVCKRHGKGGQGGRERKRLIRGETSQNRQPCCVVHAVFWRSVWDSSRSSMTPDLRSLSMLVGGIVGVAAADRAPTSRSAVKTSVSSRTAVVIRQAGKVERRQVGQQVNLRTLYAEIRSLSRTPQDRRSIC
jgi:hypothetical protein